ncbi:MAG: hypothetical protein MUF61_02735 [archaeon]|jgi:hypothetical protein|nr:hypothetical protein [archaeon]
MQKEDIIAGLKQALARGESKEEAVQSFVNAGYSAADINDAAATVLSSAQEKPKPLPQSTPVANAASTGSVQQLPKPTSLFSAPESPAKTESQKAGVSNGMKIAILVAALLVLIALGISLFFFNVF